MTKLATAACAMQLVEQGLVGLDDDARRLVPALGRLHVLRGFVGRDSKHHSYFSLAVSRLSSFGNVPEGIRFGDP